MTKILSSQVDCKFSLLSSVNNTGSETITVNSGFSLRKKIFNSGFSNQTTRYIILGEVVRNKYTDVAVVKIEAGTGKFFRNSPCLKNNNKNIKLSLKSIEKNGEEIISFSYNLQYKNTKQSRLTDNIVASLTYNNETTFSRSTSISSLIVGNEILPNKNISRIIKVLGTPGATFGLTINSVDINSDNIYQTSILSQSNSTIIGDDGTEMSVLSKKIPSRGIFRFSQDFPSLGISSSLKAAVSGRKDNIALSSTSLGIRKNDKVIMKEIADGTNVTVASVNADGTVNLSSNITAIINSPIRFERQQKYYINLVPSLTSTLGAKIPTTDPTYTLNQYLDPTITLKVSTAAELLTINGGGNGVEDYKYYKGKANTIPKSHSHQRSTYSLTYELVVANTGSHTFTAIRKPNFSNRIKNHTISISNPTGTADVNTPIYETYTNKQVSDWTNTLATENGGTEVMINNISIGSAGSTKMTITLVFQILKWGISDVTMELDLDKILTVG